MIATNLKDYKKNGASTDMENTEQELWLAQQIINGDSESLKSFYDLYADDLYGFICHLMSGSDRQDIEDIWQETLLASLNGLTSFQGKSRLFTWLCAIARFKIASFYRRRGQSLQPILDMPLESIGEMMDTSPLPEKLIVHHEVRARVIEVMQNLPVQYRQILIARYIDGQSVDEIAQFITRSYKATESLLSRARQRFQELFIKSGGDINE